MRRIRVFGAGVAVMLTLSIVPASGAFTGSPCKPVKGVSRCVFGIQLTPGGEPEPLQVGQAIQAEWWGRGSYFNAGRYSFLCHEVIFTGATVAHFSGGAPVFAVPSATFVGYTGSPCTTAMGTAQVSADASHWMMQLSVKESSSLPGQFVISDVLKTSTKEPVKFTAVYSEVGVPPTTCTWMAGSVKGTSMWAGNEQIMGMTAGQRFKLDKTASNSPQCPASGKFETNWRFSAASPAGGLLPLVLAIH
jgi:hypothetical protein